MDSPFELTDEQVEVAEQAADDRVLVTAGPGTGKTFSLIRRLEFLVEDDGLEADEVVVLSFSRAAVREIRSRLAAHGSAAQHVTVRTFDSFATQLLAETDPDGRWQQRSYNGRIEDWIRLLRQDGDAKRIVAEIRHLVVDEVQDLVGVRADLVKVLLESISGGFTLLGDPAQGIYGFQLEDSEERVRGSAALYHWVRRTFTNELTERTLTTNFRARDTSVQPSPEHGKALQDVEADYAAIQYQLRTRLMQCNPLGTLQDAVPLLSEMSGSSAVLCRTNGQALLISRELHRLGVPHRLQRSAHDRVLPPWLGELFLSRRNESRASQDDLRAVLSRYDFAIDEAWTLLKRMDRSRKSPSLNLADVRDRLIAGSVPDELTRPSACNLVVSTIHRAKGLEFDHVVVVDPGEPGDDPVDQAEGARTLYVAMTRPRDVLMHIAPVDRFGWKYLRKFRDDRWAECGFGKKQQGVRHECR